LVDDVAVRTEQRAPAYRLELILEVFDLVRGSLLETRPF
jgi:hypothetical protein